MLGNWKSAALAIAVVVMGAGPVFAQDASEFYRGKQIRILVV
jgi:hypothetical protein